MLKNIRGEDYNFLIDIRDDHEKRESFNRLADKTFGVNFRFWYDCGNWTNKYITYSLSKGNQVVSNVSVNVMKFKIADDEKFFIQIGTVMTEKEYRRKGLADFLMRHVLDDWKGLVDNIYLYSNKSSLDFYPKYGFKAVPQYRYIWKSAGFNLGKKLKKLNMDIKMSQDLLHSYYIKNNQFSKVQMIYNKELLEFYCREYLKDNIYYSEDTDLIIIMDKEREFPIIYEILGDSRYDLLSVLDILHFEENSIVELGFQPLEEKGIEKLIMDDIDNKLYVLKQDSLFSKGEIKLPFLSQA